MTFRLSHGALVFLTLLCALRAQTTTSTISGTVKDETGAVLPGVAVSIRDVGIGLTRTAVSDDEGRYSVPELSSGNYEVQAVLAGFQTAVRSGINLTVGRHAVVELTLRVGAVDEKVVVSGEAPLVETTSSSLAGLVGESQIRDLPLNGRNFVQLTLLETGVSQQRSAGGGSLSGNGLKMSFHGARADFNNFMMDGTSINSVNGTAIGGSSGQAMGVETIKEFQVITSNFSAEFGRAGGGVINVVTKSGTNELHGSIFEFLRNSALDARNFFDLGKNPPPFKRNQFGFSLGGPIKRDKTFVFGGYEGLRESLGQTLIALVPTVSARQGVLPNETVTVSPKVKPYLDLWPLPNGRDSGNGAAEFIRGDTDETIQDFYQVRFDHIFADSDSFFARYTLDDSTKDISVLIPTWKQRDKVRSQYLTIEEKKIISPRVLNVFRFGFNRTRVAFLQDPLDPRVFDRSFWYIPNGSVPGLGTLTVTGVDNPGGVINRPRDRLDNVFQWTDTLTQTRGAHSLKIGSEVQRIQTNETDTNNGQGVFMFANLRNFLLAQPATFVGAIAGSDFTRGYRQTLFALFAQDDIRLRPNLTLNLGVRWEFVTDPSEVNGKAAHVNDALVESSTIVGNPLIKLPKDNVAPRIGFAWDPFSNGKTSIRGGFGLFDQMIFRQWYYTGRVMPPFVQYLAAQAPLIAFPDPFVPGATQQKVLDHVQYDNRKLPYMMQYNLSLQRELVRNTVLTVGYVGSRGLHLGLFKDINVAPPQISADGRKFFATGLQRRNPTWTQARIRALEGDSWYHALQLKLNHRMTGRLQFQASYTMSHSIDTVSDKAGDFTNSAFSPQDPFNLAAERGHSSFDLRHVLVTNFTYDLPMGRGLSGIGGKFLQGWQVNGIVSVSSGVPFTLENSLALDRDRDLATSNGSRPDLVAARSNNPILGGPDRYYDPTAFRLQEAGFYGNLGRNTVIGPGLGSLDFALVKNTAVYAERVSLQFRTEFFNLLNRANFGLPNRTVFLNATGVPSGSAGRITQTVTTSRQLQFGLRLTF